MTLRSFHTLLALMGMFLSLVSAQQAMVLGDLDNDSVATVRDIAIIAGHFSGTGTLTDVQKQLADVNKDGAVNDADMDELVKEILGTRNPERLPLSTVRFTSPSSGEADVAVTRETVVHFTVPLSLSAALDTTKFQAEFGGKKILSRVEISSDRKKATLFYLEPLPSNARIRGMLDTTGLTDLLNRPVDGDADGQGGGVHRFSFDTLSITPLSSTAIVGRVIASERGTGGVETPLAGVTITVDGAEETLRAVTDAQGNFTLSPCPAGTFFVKIDGRTSPRSAWPHGDYYPFVGKKWHAIAGRTDNLSGDIADTVRGTIYLPCVRSGSLQPTSATQETTVQFPVGVLTANPALAGTELQVPANSLYADDGTRGGRVGIAPVAPDRLPSPLPPGLNLPLVITIQTDGATNFDRPVPVSFPNTPDPVTGQALPPRAKSALWSFDHDTGEWEIAGTMTVTEDGKLVKTDPGVGVRQPGWHGQQPGSQNGITGPTEPPCEASRASLAAFLNSGVDLGQSSLLAANGLADLGLSLTDSGAPPFMKFLSGVSLANNAVGCYQASSVFSASCAQFGVGAVGVIADVASLNPAWAPVARIISLGAGAAGAALDANELLNKMGDVEKNGEAYKAALQKCLDQSSNTGGEIIANVDQLMNVAPFTLDELADISELSQAFVNLKVGVDRVGANRENVQKFINDSTSDNPTGDLPPNQMDRIYNDIGFVADAQSGILENRKLLDVFIQKYQAIDRALDAFRSPSSIPGRRTGRLIFHSNSNNQAREPLFYLLLNGQLEDRFRLAPNQSMNRILAPNTKYEVWIYDPSRKMITKTSFFSPPNGQVGIMPPTVLLPDNGIDTDVDDLSVDAERIIGTNQGNRDTDGDGIFDGIEVRQGTNPLDGLIVATGVIASAPTSGYARDVSALNNIAVTANGQAGVTLFNVLNGLNPVRLKEIDTPGIALSVACNDDRIAVADLFAGLAIVDISIPASARIVHQVNLGSPANCVTTYGPIACVGLVNGTVAAVDLRTGSVIWRVNSTSGSVQDLVVSGQTLYVYHVGRVNTISMDSLAPAVVGSVSLSGGVGAGNRRLRLAVGPGVLYAAHTNGWNVLNIVSDPLNPVVVEQRLTVQFGFKQLVSTGSSLALAAASPNSTDDGPHHIDLYNAGARLG
jgi:hypothetical protein